MTESIQIPPVGVYVPVPTFFKPSADDSTQPELDIDTQIAHAVHLARAGIHGLVLLGSTGEALHLSRAERKELVSRVRTGLGVANFKDYPIMVGVLTNAAEDAIEQVNDAKESGAQWALVLAPGYFGAAVTMTGVVDWYKFVLARSEIPILIYNYPGVTNNLTLTPDVYATLATHEKVVGCKMSHGNVSYHVQVSLHPKIDANKFRVYSGFGQQLGPIVAFGAAGVIDGLAAIYPRTVVRLFNAVSKTSTDAQSVKEARELQYKVSAAEEFVVKTGIVGIKEAVYRVLEMGHPGIGRLPLGGRLSDEQWEQWSEIMTMMKQSEKQ